MKTISSLTALFVLFLLLGFGVTMITPEVAIAEEDLCNSGCGTQTNCANNIGQCSQGFSPYYTCKQANGPVGCLLPFDCGCYFAFCGDECFQL